MDCINWINETINKMEKKLSDKAIIYRDFIPDSIENDKFVTRYDKDPTWWTNGFWGGLMWLLYKNTGKQCFIDAAKSNEELLDRAFEVYDGLHHDVGFMWDYTAGEGYRQTGNEKSKKRLIRAANFLAARYNIDGGFITSWNGEIKKGWVRETLKSYWNKFEEYINLMEEEVV